MYLLLTVLTREVVCSTEYLGIFDFTKDQGPVLARGLKECEGGASRMAGSGVEVTSLRMQNMSSGVTVRAMVGGGGVVV
jgi:hypothetical protein